MEIWSKILGLERVSIQDNFFDVGGHSLLAMQMVAHISSELGVNLPVRVVFDAPTLAEQAEFIRILAQRPESGSVLFEPGADDSADRESGEI